MVIRHLEKDGTQGSALTLAVLRMPYCRYASIGEASLDAGNRPFQAAQALPMLGNS